MRSGSEALITPETFAGNLHERGPELRTERLYLRRWRATDREPFAALNADPRVMEYFPAPLSPEESEALTSRIEGHFEQHGFGVWAVEIKGTAPFAGFIGLSIPRFEAHFTPCVEIGWRLASEYWGCGYATEGARATSPLALSNCVSARSCRSRCRATCAHAG